MPDPTTAPVTAEDLRERAEAAVEDWFNHLADDDEPTVEQIGQGVAAAVLVALAGDPGDLPARMAEAIALTRNGPAADGRARYETIAERQDILAEAHAVMSVRWEHAAHLAARLAESEARAEQAEGELSSLRDHRSRWETEHAEVERLRTELANRDALLEKHRETVGVIVGQREEAKAERDLLRETLAESDLGALTLAQWEAIAAADADRDRLEAELAGMRDLFEAANTVACARTAERDSLRAAATRARGYLTRALDAWTPEHEYYQDRAGRKGYSHDETAAEVYGAAMKVVAAALAALAATESSEDAPTETAKPDWRERARARVGDQVAARMAELMAEPPLSAEEFDEAMRRNKAEAEAHLDRQSRGISETAPDAPTGGED